MRQFYGSRGCNRVRPPLPCCTESLCFLLKSWITKLARPKHRRLANWHCNVLGSWVQHSADRAWVRVLEVSSCFLKCILTSKACNVYGTSIHYDHNFLKLEPTRRSYTKLLTDMHMHLRTCSVLGTKNTLPYSKLVTKDHVCIGIGTAVDVQVMCCDCSLQTSDPSSAFADNVHHASFVWQRWPFWFFHYGWRRVDCSS